MVELDGCISGAVAGFRGRDCVPAGHRGNPDSAEGDSSQCFDKCVDDFRHLAESRARVAPTAATMILV